MSTFFIGETNSSCWLDITWHTFGTRLCYLQSTPLPNWCVSHFLATTLYGYCVIFGVKLTHCKGPSWQRLRFMWLFSAEPEIDFWVSTVGQTWRQIGITRGFKKWITWQIQLCPSGIMCKFKRIIQPFGNVFWNHQQPVFKWMIKCAIQDMLCSDEVEFSAIQNIWTPATHHIPVIFPTLELLQWHWIELVAIKYSVWLFQVILLVLSIFFAKDWPLDPYSLIQCLV